MNSPDTRSNAKTFFLGMLGSLTASIIVMLIQRSLPSPTISSMPEDLNESDEERGINRRN